MFINFFFSLSLSLIICSVCFETFVYNAICYVCGTRQSYIIFETVYMLEESPCSICGKQVNTDGVFCNSCNLWVHPDCNHLGEVEFKILIDSDDSEPWSCIKCNLNALNHADNRCEYFDAESFNSHNFENKHLSFLHLNISSLDKHFDNFDTFLQSINHCFKVIGLTETRINFVD